MFIILKTLLLYVICFYYCVLTPGTRGGEGSAENLLWETVTVSIVQAFIAAGLFAFFDWPTTFVPWVAQDGFLGLLGTVGVVAGLWTFIGGLCYPMLHELLEKNEKEISERKRKERIDNSRKVTAQIEKEKKAFEELIRSNPQSALEILMEASSHHTKGNSKKIKYEFLKSNDYVIDQLKRVFKIINPDRKVNNIDF